jgi:2,3-bisphosphoglycerate-independent phosphoglycerate mutase
LGCKVSDADPHAEGEKVLLAVGVDTPSKKTAMVVNEFVKRSYEILKKHPVNLAREKEGKPPANIVLPRGAGEAPHLRPFKERYGFPGAAVVETGLIAGIARYLEMSLPEVAGATGGYDTDEIAIARAIALALQEHDFVLCNFKAPDLAGHDGDPMKKMECAQKLDRLAAELLKHLPQGVPVHLVISADHSTPVSFKDHTGDSVPILFWGPNVRPDSVNKFGERACASGSIGRIRGSWIMNLLTNLMGTQEKYGA